jgi:hypothetical protein
MLRALALLDASVMLTWTDTLQAEHLEHHLHAQWAARPK